MTRLRIIGAGGHGKVVADVAQACGYTDIAFVDQSWPARTTHGRWTIIGKDTSDRPLFCAIGDNTIRAQLADPAMPVLIHPAAVVSQSAAFGSGTVLVAGVVVNADTTVGRGVILNTACSVDHDCVIGDFVHISPGARLAGNVHVGDGAWIGIGAVVREGVRIGKNAIVAAGAAVIEDVADNARVGGVPAKPL